MIENQQLKNICINRYATGSNQKAYNKYGMILFFISFSLHAYCQNSRVSINLKERPLYEAMAIIEKQTGYLFYYSVSDVDTKHTVTISLANTGLTEVLKKLFQNFDLTFSFIHRHIILKKEKRTKEGLIKSDVEDKDFFISGTVKNEDGELLEGVTVTVKNSDIGTISKVDGSFFIKIPNKEASLLFSSVGYTSMELVVTDTAKLNLTLHTEQSILDDIVVVGYSSQRRKDLTGSISKIEIEDLKKANVQSFDEALAGRIAGMQVTSQDGQPGAQINIVIRGSNSLTQDNSPLYVIDGFPIEGFNTNLLSPNEIESIEILKDASATAIYGARAANGVVVISTKKGKVGPGTINYDLYYGFQRNLKTIPLLSPYDYVKLQIERDPINAKNVFIAPNKSLEDYKKVEGIDWQNELFRSASISNNFLSINGGNKQTQYAFSGSINFQNGIIISSNFKRLQGRASIDQMISKKSKIGINFNYSKISQEGPNPGGTAVNSTFNLLFQAWGYRPIVGKDSSNLLNNVFDPLINPLDNAIVNPVSSAKNELRNNTTNNVSANVFYELTLSKKIKFRTIYGINNSLLRKDVFNNSKTSSGNQFSYTGYGVNGSITYLENTSWLNENTVTYTNIFDGKHDLTVVLGATEQESKNAYYGSASIKIPNESLGLSGLDEGIPLSVQSSNSLWTLASFLGRINYNFNSKYFFSFTYRADGSSRFAKKNKWGFFPSGSFAWKFGEELFMKRMNVINDGKLRISYGITGNNRVGDFSYLSMIGSPIESVYAFNGNINSNQGANRINLGNPDLRWETTSQLNIGTDITIFKKLGITVDIYRKTTKDLLLNAQLPTSTGYANAFKNIGKVKNEGLEISVTYSTSLNKPFRWKSEFNISFNKSKTLALTDGQQVLASSVSWDQYFSLLPAYVAKIEHPISCIYGLLFDGLYQYNDFNLLSNNRYVLKDNVATNGNARANIQPGDLKYKDLNGDGITDSKDYTIIGNSLPKHVGGFVNNFYYKCFDLNIFLQWSYGNDIVNANRYLFEAAYRPYLNQFATYANRWTADNQNTSIARVGGSLPYQYSNRVVEDGSFLRVKTISLGYTPTSTLIKKLKLKSLRFSVSCQNLFTITSYSGLDPEVSVRNTALTQGFDFSPYPRAMSFSIGLNVFF